MLMESCDNYCPLKYSSSMQVCAKYAGWLSNKKIGNMQVFLFDLKHVLSMK